MPSKDGLDPATTLGVTLKEPIVTGEGFEDWLFSDTVCSRYGKWISGHDGPVDVVQVLKEAGYWQSEIESCFWLLSAGHFAPSQETLHTMYVRAALPDPEKRIPNPYRQLAE